MVEDMSDFIYTVVSLGMSALFIWLTIKLCKEGKKG